MLSSVPEAPADTPAREGGHEQRDRRVVLRGFAVLIRGARQQPRAFTISVLGSSLWALMTVAQAYVLGRVTQNTVLPALSDGHVLWGSLVGAGLLIMAVAGLK